VWWYGAIPARWSALDANANGEPEREDSRVRKRLRGRRKQDCSPDNELIEECEAFLSGHLVEDIEMRAQVVPVWAWTNLLAHGSAKDLRTECASPWLRRSMRDGQWRQARSCLAAEVLDCASSCGPLEELQQAVLVPLELQLASRVEVARWCPGRWANSVKAVLNERRQAGRYGRF
jgi:hypothetical protein